MYQVLRGLQQHRKLCPKKLQFGQKPSWLRREGEKFGRKNCQKIGRTVAREGSEEGRPKTPAEDQVKMLHSNIRFGQKNFGQIFIPDA
jgi:hypothetical protein